MSTRTVLILVALMGCDAVVLAKPPDDPKAVQARQHYEAGLGHFNLREFPQAIAEFEAGYRLKPDPVFLYNLGQAHRLADNPEQAVYFYRAYLRTSADVAHRAEVEERIGTLEKLIVDKKAAARPPDHTLAPKDVAKPAPQAPAAAPVVAQGERSSVPVYRRWWLWTSIGIGAVGVGLGLGLGLGLQHRAQDPSLGVVGPGAGLLVRF
jgi:tetratricopeptide (TPR) repeat protein